MAAENLHSSVTLQQLLQGIAEAPAIVVGGLQDDSRYVQPGDVFVAVQGASNHGLEFAERAISLGAVAVVWDSTSGNEASAKGSVPFVAVPDLAAQLGDLANRFFELPSSVVNVTGVTGTNGKTTVAFILAQCFSLLGRSCGYVGTLGYGVDELVVDRGLTTPPCLDLHKKLGEFRDQGVDCAAIEVSSHALTQQRPAGVRFSAAIFTNLSRDHVDYHGDMASYAASKAHLFTDYDCQHRIINIDSEYGDLFVEHSGADAILTTCQPDADVTGHRFVRADSFSAIATGYRVALTSSWGDATVDVPLTGAFNVSNAIQVLATLLAHGVEFADACEVIAVCTAPPGRMQAVAIDGEQSLPAVYVDYAHTPAALESALQALRPHVNGKLWCVFGCGGDRDVGKRPQMGEIAGRLADHAVVTNDNPRSESPGKIIADVMAGISGQAVAIEDRAAAIALAISDAASDDAVLIAGKGHEDYQIIGERRLDFSDYQAAKANLAKRANARGSQHA